MPQADDDAADVVAGHHQEPVGVELYVSLDHMLPALHGCGPALKIARQVDADPVGTLRRQAQGERAVGG